jgi:hypothetical protein
MDNLTKINKIDFANELNKMENLISIFDIYKPLMGKLLRGCGLLSQSLLKSLIKEKREFKSVDNMDFIIASFYANISYLQLEKYGIFENNKEIFKRHTILSANMFDQNSRIHYLIKNHHEKPNGSGIFKTQVTDKEICCLEIADTFIFNSLDTDKSPGLTKKENIEYFRNEYQFSSLLSKTDIDNISEVLMNYGVKD